jgi:hypothetical protein
MFLFLLAFCKAHVVLAFGILRRPGRVVLGAFSNIFLLGEYKILENHIKSSTKKNNIHTIVVLYYCIVGYCSICLFLTVPYDSVRIWFKCRKKKL